MMAVDTTNRGQIMPRRELASELVLELRRSIQNSGQSLNQLSTACGVDRGRLSRFMRGERDLTLTAAAKLCKVLGLHLCDTDTGSPREAVASAVPAVPPAEDLDAVAKQPPAARTDTPTVPVKKKRPSKYRGAAPENFEEGQRPRKGKGAR